MKLDTRNNNYHWTDDKTVNIHDHSIHEALQSIRMLSGDGLPDKYNPRQGFLSRKVTKKLRKFIARYEHGYITFNEYKIT